MMGNNIAASRNNPQTETAAGSVVRKACWAATDMTKTAAIQDCFSTSQGRQTLMCLIWRCVLLFLTTFEFQGGSHLCQ